MTIRRLSQCLISTKRKKKVKMQNLIIKRAEKNLAHSLNELGQVKSFVLVAMK